MNMLSQLLTVDGYMTFLNLSSNAYELTLAVSSLTAIIYSVYDFTALYRAKVCLLSKEDLTVKCVRLV
jgi:hypothetical protein